MKKFSIKKTVGIIAMTAILSIGATLGVIATTGDVEITALLTPGISVMYDGVRQTLTDEQGNVVYPINYNGTVYVPIRGIGQIFGSQASWNGDYRMVTLPRIATPTPIPTAVPTVQPTPTPTPTISPYDESLAGVNLGDSMRTVENELGRPFEEFSETTNVKYCFYGDLDELVLVRFDHDEAEFIYSMDQSDFNSSSDYDEEYIDRNNLSRTYAVSLGEDEQPSEECTEFILGVLINAFRDQHGEYELDFDYGLEGMAVDHSNNMLDEDDLDHDVGWGDLDERMEQEEYNEDFADWDECIFYGDEATPIDVFHSWIAITSSDEYRDYLLDGYFEEIGIGVAIGNNGDLYATAILAVYD